MKKYSGLDFLRCIMCFGIIAMHIRANNSYSIDGFFYNKVIPSFVDFVFVFMAVSAFGLCCGYFGKAMAGQINWSDFYRKRYAKVWFFFAFVIVIDLVFSFSMSSLAEAITELTLMHGFVPKYMSVIGVGWFLGTLFIFYLVFPFFCTLMSSKRKAILVLLISLVLNCICARYFGLDRSNFLYSACFFVAGGLVFLCKEEIAKIRIYWLIPALIVFIILYYLQKNLLTTVLLTAAILVVAIAVTSGTPRVVHFLSGISLEMYLSHMIIFRVFEKLHFTTVIGNGWAQYVLTLFCVYIGAAVFSYVAQQGINLTIRLVKNLLNLK